MLALYVQRLDDRNVDGLVALFTPDACVETSSGLHKGHAGIREWLTQHFAGLPQGRMEVHHAVNPVLTINPDGETGQGRTDVLCFSSTKTAPWELEVVTRHHDRFAKAGDQWFFAEKAIEGRGGFKRTSNTVPNIVSID